MKDYVEQAIMMILVSNGCKQGDLSREKGEGFRSIKNTGR